VAQWTDPAESATHIAWTREVWSRVEPLISAGTYLNHLAGDDSPERVRASYGPSIGRLAVIKAQYDPTNIFRLNANIAPAG
jgi:FAD/FMN-containing dehydrogenase